MKSVQTYRFEELDAWRGICAVLVACFHFHVGPGLENNNVFMHLSLFVDFFFILSGFVIYHAYDRRLTDAEKGVSFMIKRFGRVWPLHVVTLLFLLGLELAKFAAQSSGSIESASPAFVGETSLSTFAMNIGLVQSVGFLDHLSWNYPSWSISTEFWTYVLCTGVLVALPRQRWPVIALIMFASLVYVSYLGTYLNSSAAGGLQRCFLGFFTGVALNELFKRVEGHLSKMSRVSASLVEIALIGSVLGLFAWIPNDAATLLALPAFAACILVFAVGRGVVSYVLRLKPMAILGMLSYSIYMIHDPLIRLLHRIVRLLEQKAGITVMHAVPGMEERFYYDIPNEPVRYAIYAVFVMVVVSLSWFTYKFIEEPSREYFRSKSDIWAAAIFGRRRRDEAPV